MYLWISTSISLNPWATLISTQDYCARHESSRVKFVTTSKTLAPYTSFVGRDSVSINEYITTRQVRAIASDIFEQTLTPLHIAKAIEYMIVDALLLADPYMKISQQIHEPDKFLYLTDDIKTRIEMTDAPVSGTRLSEILLANYHLGTSTGSGHLPSHRVKGFVQISRPECLCMGPSRALPPVLHSRESCGRDPNRGQPQERWSADCGRTYPSPRYNPPVWDALWDEG